MKKKVALTKWVNHVKNKSTGFVHSVNSQFIFRGLLLLTHTHSPNSPISLLAMMLRGFQNLTRVREQPRVCPSAIATRRQPRNPRLIRGCSHRLAPKCLGQRPLKQNAPDRAECLYISAPSPDPNLQAEVIYIMIDALPLRKKHKKKDVQRSSKLEQVNWRLTVTGTQFTCFTSIKVQILTPEVWVLGTHWYFTRTKVLSVLIYILGARSQWMPTGRWSGLSVASHLEVTQFTCFTSTKVQILTPDVGRIKKKFLKYQMIQPNVS